MKPRHFLALVLIFFIGMFINQCVRGESSSSQDFWSTLGLRSEGTSNGFRWNFPGAEEATRTLPDVVVRSSGITTLAVSNTDGDVTITGVDGQSDIVVKQTVSVARAGRRAAEDIAAYRLDHTSEAGTLTLKPDFPEGSNLTVNLDVTVPKAMSVSVDTTDGGISITGTDGTVTAHAVDGSVSATDITTTGAEFATTDGSITLARVAPGAGAGARRLKAATADGSITLVDANLRQFNADVSSNNGHIDVSASSFAGLSVKSQDGNVSLTSVTATTTVQTASGGVTAGDCRGRMEIAATDGSVHLTGVTDEAIVDTSEGKIFVDVAGATPPLRLETSDGSIDLKLGPSDDFTIRATAPDKSIGNGTGLASTTSGGITTIGAGPTIVTLKTNGGGIQITRGGTK
jgi:DUF4097 and DUF4098 domain-containing protein YvlB